MKFLADVNITQTLIKHLRKNGHNVLDIKKLDPNLSDTEVIKLARQENRIILTHDKDFEALAKYPKHQVGIVAIRLKKQSALHFCDKLDELLTAKTEETLVSSLTIIEEDSMESYPY